MKDTNQSSRNTGRKRITFLLPALLTGILVFEMLPQSQVALREIPARLELIEEVAAETPEAAPAAKKITPPKGKEEDAGPAGVGDYEDGVFEGSAQGYGGQISVQVTVENGQITDIKILSAPGETDPYFTLAQSVLDQVKHEQTWEVDTISGATYSSRGILGAVQNALTGETVENAPAPQVTPQGTTQQDAYKEPAAYKDGTYQGTAQGFGGPITVEVVIKDGKIKSIRIISASGETSSYLSNASSVISRILSKGSPNVDAVSGATYSSTGIINAVKRALQNASADGSKKEKIKDNPKPKKDTKSKEKTPKQEKYTEPAAYEDGTYYGTAEGFGGDIKVKVVIKNGKLKKISIVEASGETKEYLDKAKAVIPEMVKSGSPNVDTVSGATFSSTGIINAVKRAMSQAAKKKSGNDTKGASDDSSGSGAQKPDPSVYPAEKLTDGVYTGTGAGFAGTTHPIEVQVTVSGGKITNIEITDGSGETPAYLNRARSLLSAMISAQSAEVDAVSGATMSSNGIKAAVGMAISKAAGSYEEDPEDNPGQGGTDTPGTDTPDVPLDESYEYQDGTYTETVACTRTDWFDYDIHVSLTVNEGKITDIQIEKGDDFTDEDHQEDNDGYLALAANGGNGSNGMVSKILNAQGTNVDTVSGATWSSLAIKEAVSGILSGIQVQKETGSEEEQAEQSTRAAAMQAALKVKETGKGIAATADDRKASGQAENVSDAEADQERAATGQGDTAASQGDTAVSQGDAAAVREDEGDGVKHASEANPDADQTPEDKPKIEAETEEKAETEAKAKGETEEKEAEAKVKKEAEAKVKKEAEAKAKKEEEAKAKKEAEAKAKKEAEVKAKKEAEAKAKQEAEEKARKEAEEKARKEAESKKAEQEASVSKKAMSAVIQETAGTPQEKQEASGDHK